MRNFKTTLAYVVLVAFFALNQVDCQCADLVQQYFQCKYLKMITNIDYNSNNYSSLPAYLPDPSIANNQLNDTFYQNQNLSKMTFDQAMQFFWKIYNETNNCNSSFCDCVSKGVIDKLGSKPSLLFRNNSIFTQMKIILSAFNTKFKPYLLPYSQLRYRFYQPNLTTLNQFCVNYDYSLSRGMYYNSTQMYSCYQNFDSGTYFSCGWSVKVVNKKLSVNLTNSQLANLLSCNMIPLKKCPSQQKRFVALSTWYSEFSTMTFPWKNIPAYLDTLISRADSFKPKITFAYSYFGTYLNYLSTYYNNTYHTFDLTNKTDFTAVAFNSTQLRIDCHFNTSNGQVNIEWYNLTYIYDKTHSYNLFIHTSIIYPINAYFSNGTIIKDKNNQNWIQIFYNTDQYSSGYGYQYVFIYDFYANSYVSFGSNSLSLYAHITMFPKANGFMVTNDLTSK